MMDYKSEILDLKRRLARIEATIPHSPERIEAAELHLPERDDRDELNELTGVILSCAHEVDARGDDHVGEIRYCRSCHDDCRVVKFVFHQRDLPATDPPNPLRASVEQDNAPAVARGAGSSRYSIHDPLCAKNDAGWCDCSAVIGHTDRCAVSEGFEDCDCVPIRFEPDRPAIPAPGEYVAVRKSHPDGKDETVGAYFERVEHDGTWLVALERRGKMRIEPGRVLRWGADRG